MLIKRADSIYEDGTSDNGYFIRECVAGCIIGSIITFTICFMFASVIWSVTKQNNYIIPKASAKGLYLQLEDGKLYKKQ